MWLATLDGFFSTVIDKMEPGRMPIRARCEKDIKNLYNRYRDKCPSMRKPTSDDTRDYRYRISISKRDWVGAHRVRLWSRLEGVSARLLPSAVRQVQRPCDDRMSERSQCCFQTTKNGL